MGLAWLFLSACSHRYAQPPSYFKKGRYFDPSRADKSHKVRRDDEGFVSGVQPQARHKQPQQSILDHPTMKSYRVNGKSYYPSVVDVGATMKGIASWYGPDFNGKRTSNGEIYDMYAFTAAHKTLPMHTIVRVTNLENRKQVTVRINDRGPFVKNRIIDLSKAAARAIDMTHKGTAPVKLEVLGFNSNPKALKAEFKKPRQISHHAKQLRNFYIQIGSFRKFQGAKLYQERFTQLGESHHAIIKTSYLDDKPIYRVLVDGFFSEDEAKAYIQEHSAFRDAFIVRD